MGCHTGAATTELTREHCGSPSRNITIQKAPTTAIFRRPLLRTGNSSTTAVTTVSSIANWLSTPSVNSIMKNNTDHNGATGIIAIPSGKATNARPGPVTREINSKHWSKHWNHVNGNKWLETVNIVNTPWVKKVRRRVFVTTSPNIDRFSKFFHWHTLSEKFAIKLSIKIPQHLKLVATLL